MDKLATLGRGRALERLFELCDFSAIDQEISANAELFDAPLEQDFRRNFKASPFKDSPAIICRMSYDPIEMEGEEPTEEELLHHLQTKGLTNLQASDTELYAALPEVYQVVMWLSGCLRAEQLGRVLVARLQPGGKVKPHRDYGPYHDFYDRFHICIGGEGCYFSTGRETVKMLPGEIWWFDNQQEHEVHNDTGAPRDHVVLDLKLKGDKHARLRGPDSSIQ